MQLLTPDHLKKTSRLLNDSASQDPLLVGIIGCGRIGSHIAHCLLTFGEVNPHEMKISTRRPETLTELQEKGVLCAHNNKDVAASVHLLFLCILPAQLQTVAEEIKGHIPSNTIVYSLASALTLPRIKQLLSHKQVILPEYRWDAADTDISWDHTMEVTGMFAQRNTLELTCPLTLHKTECPIETNERLMVQFVCALANFLRKADLTRMEVTNILNAIFLGHSSKEAKEEILEPSDFAETTDRQFPEFNLSSVATADSSLLTVLTANTTMRKYVIDKYCGLFQHYLEWKNQSLQLTKKPISLSGD